MNDRGCFLLVLFSISCDTMRSAARRYTFGEFYVTDTTTTFSKIPSSCHLFGTQISRTTTVDEVFLATNTTKKYFWVSAKLEFQRKINPIGEIKCRNASSVNDFSECSNRCRSDRYFSYNGKNKKCACLKYNNGRNRLGSLFSCEDELCAFGGHNTCVKYEHVTRDDDLRCETVTLPKRNYNVVPCLSHENIGYICNNGTYRKSDNTTTWFEAYMKCGQHDGLLRHDVNNLVTNQPPGTYWVSYFRKTYYSWTRYGHQNFCTAVNIKENGTLHLMTTDCDDTLPAVCHRKSNYGSGMLNGLLYGVSVAVVMCLIIVLVFILYIKNKRNNCIIKHSQERQERCPSPSG